MLLHAPALNEIYEWSLGIGQLINEADILFMVWKFHSQSQCNILVNSRKEKHRWPKRTSLGWEDGGLMSSQLQRRAGSFSVQMFSALSFSEQSHSTHRDLHLNTAKEPRTPMEQGFLFLFCFLEQVWHPGCGRCDNLSLSKWLREKGGPIQFKVNL